MLTKMAEFPGYCLDVELHLIFCRISKKECEGRERCKFTTFLSTGFLKKKRTRRTGEV